MKIVFALLFCGLAVLATETNAERLIWSDEFNEFNLGTWKHLVTAWGGGNWEFQYYRNNRKNSFVRDGKLFIRPTFTAEEIDVEHGRIEEPDCNFDICASESGYGDIVSPVFSARLFTQESFSFTYGRVEIRAKMPTGDWMWPAIWLMPTDNVYGKWPRSGEIDMVEVRSNPNLITPWGDNVGLVEVGSTLHFGEAWNNKGYTNGMLKAAPGRNWGDDFYTYEMIWTPDVMKFTVNGQVIKEVQIPEGGFTELGHEAGHWTDIYKGKAKNAPFDQRFHFVVNVAIGGGFFPQDWTSGGRPTAWTVGDVRRQFWNSRDSWLHTWGDPDTHSMQIDYIRVYQD